MLGSINKFLLKYPGLWGTPFYLFLFAAIATAGSTAAGIGLFYSNIFNAAVDGFVPGLQIIGEEVAMPALEGIFNVASGIAENIAPEIEPPIPS